MTTGTTSNSAHYRAAPAMVRMFRLLAALATSLRPSVRAERRRTEAAERRARAERRGLQCCLVHVAKADGPITEREREFIIQLVEKRAWGVHGNSHDDISKSIDTIERMTDLERLDWHIRPLVPRPFESRQEVADFVTMLIELAEIDGSSTAKEDEAIEAIGRLFGLLRPEIRLLKSRRRGRASSGGAEGGRRARDDRSRTQAKRSTNSMVALYALLGCAPTDSISTIKKKYRRLVVACHPDSHASEALSRNRAEDLLRRFHAVQAAYEEIRRSRNF